MIVNILSDYTENPSVDFGVLVTTRKFTDEELEMIEDQIDEWRDEYGDTNYDDINEAYIKVAKALGIDVEFEVDEHEAY